MLISRHISNLQKHVFMLSDVLFLGGQCHKMCITILSNTPDYLFYFLLQCSVRDN